MLIYIYILCMYLILSTLIAIGESIQFPKLESEIRFGWGISYNYIGQMHHNLNKYDVVVGLEIPDFRVIPYYQPFSCYTNFLVCPVVSVDSLLLCVTSNYTQQNYPHIIIQN